MRLVFLRALAPRRTLCLAAHVEGYGGDADEKEQNDGRTKNYIHR